MTGKDKPQDISDERLDDASGAGLIDAEPGTFGIRRPGRSTDPDRKDGNDFASTAGGSPNV